MLVLHFSCHGHCLWRVQCFRKLLSWAFPRWVGMMETLLRCIKSSKVWLLPPSVFPWEERNQPVKSRLLIPGGRDFGVQEGTMRSAVATDPKTSQNAMPPSFTSSGISYSDSYSSRESWHGLKKSPTQHNWVSWGSAGNTMKSTLLQRKSGVPSFWRSTAGNMLSGFVCASWVKSQTQHHPAQSGQHWVDANMRWGYWAPEQTLWLLL